MLDEQRQDAFVRVMTQLQSEGIQVEASKYTLGSLAKELESRVASEANGLDVDSTFTHENKMTENKA